MLSVVCARCGVNEVTNDGDDNVHDFLVWCEQMDVLPLCGQCERVRAEQKIVSIIFAEKTLFGVRPTQNPPPTNRGVRRYGK